MLDLSQTLELRNVPPHHSQALRAELVGDNQCRSAGITVQGNAPILAMCRRLIEAGVDPARPLHAYRNDTLCVVVRSIVEGAKLTVAEGSRGAPQFRSWKPMPSREGSPRTAPHRQGGVISIPRTAAGAVP